MKNARSVLAVIVVLAIAAAFAVYKFPIHKGLDIQGGMRVVLEAQVPKGMEWGSGQLETVTNIIHKRVDALGVAEPVVYPMPAENRIVVELPGVKNKQDALDIIASTAQLLFVYMPELDDGTWTTKPDATGQYEEVLIASTLKPVPLPELQERYLSKPILTGKDLKDNSVAEPQQTGKVVVHFEFKDESKQTFEDFTRSHIKKRLAIFLDNKLISAPVIQDVLPGEGVIEGNFTAASAKTLADQLNAGALPVPLKQIQLDNVEATLGVQAVHQTLIAGVVGLCLVLVVMVWWYRVPGVLAAIALCLYAVFTFAVFKCIPLSADRYGLTLTVPGIAGFILSIGMAVDANILIFERMKEERLGGKSLRASIDAGFKRAFTAILDSNVCTLITCGVLYEWGSGQVQGFALTLSIGVMLSFFTAVTVTRTFLTLFASSPMGQNDNLYALRGGFHPKLQVTKRMPLWFGISGLVIVPGLIFWALGGIKKGIEFTGGTETHAQFARPQSTSGIESALKSAGFPDSRVLLTEGGQQAFITTPNLDQAQRGRLQSELQTLGGSVLSDSSVSGTISREMTSHAVIQVIVASALIILYLALRFSLPNFVEGLKFGLCAIAALLHDILVLWGSFAILGYLFNWQIDSLFVTAMLTVIGFSVHDTIIIFDRMRENMLHRLRGESFADVADRSIEQTFARSVYTSFTVILTLIAMLLFGGPTIRLFVSALLIGIVSGTYSSIFNATPLLVIWRRLTGDRMMGTVPATATGPSMRPGFRPDGATRAARAKPPTPRPSAAPKPSAAPAYSPTVAAPSGQDTDDAIQAVPTGGGAGPARVKSKKPKRRM